MYTRCLAKELEERGEDSEEIGRWHELSEIRCCREWNRERRFFKRIAKENNIREKDIYTYTIPELTALLEKKKKCLERQYPKGTSFTQ